MHSNKVWLTFLALISLVVIWFCFGAVSKLTYYYSLDTKISVNTIEWSIEEVDEDDYLLKADYTYTFEGNNFNKSLTLSHPVYPNSYAADYAKKEKERMQWSAYFSKKRPKASTLFRTFPMKSTLSALALLALWLYFVWLGIYVTRFRQR